MTQGVGEKLEKLWWLQVRALHVTSLKQSCRVVEFNCRSKEHNQIWMKELGDRWIQVQMGEQEERQTMGLHRRSHRSSHNKVSQERHRNSAVIATDMANLMLADEVGGSGKHNRC